jgi:hypothetical protein
MHNSRSDFDLCLGCTWFILDGALASVGAIFSGSPQLPQAKPR